MRANSARAKVRRVKKQLANTIVVPTYELSTKQAEAVAAWEAAQRVKPPGIDTEAWKMEWSNGRKEPK